MYRELLEELEVLAQELDADELEIVATEVLESMEKEAKEKKSELKPFIGRGNQEFLEAGGRGFKETLKKTTLPSLGMMAGGAGVGALIAGAKGAPKSLGASLGSLAGGLGTIPLSVSQSKSDYKAIDKMIANRLGPNATKEDIKKAKLKYNLIGALPAKSASELLDEIVKVALESEE